MGIKEDLIAEMNQIDSEIAVNNRDYITPRYKRRHEAAKELAPFIAGFAIGDMVQDRNRQLAIVRTLWAYNSFSYAGSLVLINKNGKPGERVRSINSWDKWKIHQGERNGGDGR